MYLYRTAYSYVNARVKFGTPYKLRVNPLNKEHLSADTIQLNSPTFKARSPLFNELLALSPWMIKLNTSTCAVNQYFPP